MENKSLLYHKYPWLKITTNIENYVDPDYYDRLLKDYILNKKTDLDYFKRYISDIKKPQKVLELGCGTGRATKIFLKNCCYSRVDLVDLSPRMITRVRTKFSRYKNIKYIKSDAVKYLEKTNEIYDLIFTLWSFSHSTHQLLTRMGFKKGKLRIKKALKKMVLKNMKKGSRFFLIHFDSLSDEQRILIKQWKKVFPIFKEDKIQSPSKRFIDEILKSLAINGIISLSIHHYIGKAIEYSSFDEALEIFMNFHMESFFNKSKIVGIILSELTDYFRRYQKSDGRISIKPGCFIYTFTKLI